MAEQCAWVTSWGHRTLNLLKEFALVVLIKLRVRMIFDSSGGSSEGCFLQT